jgi:hypothetical protein
MGGRPRRRELIVGPSEVADRPRPRTAKGGHAVEGRTRPVLEELHVDIDGRGRDTPRCYSGGEPGHRGGHRPSPRPRFAWSSNERKGKLMEGFSRPSAEELARRLGPRWRFRLFALALLELAVAAAVILWLVGSGSGGMDEHAVVGAEVSHAAGMHTHMSPPARQHWPDGLVVGLALTTWVIAAAGVRTLSRSLLTPGWGRPGRAVALLLAVTTGTIMVLPQLDQAGSRMHIVMMAQLMVLTSATPLLLLLAMPANWRERIGVSGASAWACAIAILAVTVALHVPRIHHLVSAEPGLGWQWLVLLGVTGALTALLLGPGLSLLRGHGNVLAAGLALGVMGVLGLAMLLSPRDLYAELHASRTFISPVVDQRLAGLLMMAYDAMVLLPVLAGIGARQRGRSEGSVQPGGSLAERTGILVDRHLGPTSGTRDA